MDILELSLDFAAALLSFVVIPVKLTIPDQNTAIKVAVQSTEEYRKNGKPDPENKFFLAPVKVSAIKN